MGARSSDAQPPLPLLHFLSRLGSSLNPPSRPAAATTTLLRRVVPPGHPKRHAPKFPRAGDSDSVGTDYLGSRAACRIKKLMGQGAFGCVVAGEDAVSGLKVAIKKVKSCTSDRTAAKRLLRELRFLRELRGCSNIVNLQDVVVRGSGGQMDTYIVTDLMVRPIPSPPIPLPTCPPRTPPTSTISFSSLLPSYSIPPLLLSLPRPRAVSWASVKVDDRRGDGSPLEGCRVEGDASRGHLQTLGCPSWK